MPPLRRPDHIGPHRVIYNRNRKTILYTQDTCAICGRYVDKELPATDPMSATVDHIVPINKGGHPSDLTNLQLAHRICNILKSDKVFQESKLNTNANKIFQSRDWKKF